MGKLFFFTGTEEFSVKERVGDFIRELFGDMPEENDSLEIIRGDDPDEKYSAVLDRFITSIETPPFSPPPKPSGSNISINLTMPWMNHPTRKRKAV